MPGDPRVRELIEEVLETGGSVEDVCQAWPELLPEVREGWRRLRAIEAQVGALFPEPGSTDDHEATTPEVGPPLIPGYEILEVLGRGGVGVVYKALHLRLNRAVALKMLLAGPLATRAERQRFSRESEVVAKLRHPNIVQVHDVGDLDGRPYFTMEFVEGGSLAEMIAGTPRPARQAAELMATLADAMQAAHLGGIVHRDLKPSNILITADGTPKIGDFGLARHMEVGSSLTQSGVTVGTPSYMAPEQARGKSAGVGPAADLYALGAVLYELLTGRPPFRAESAAETLHQVITREPVSPSRLNAKVPRDLETTCLKCLRKDPQLRYAGAAALAEDLRRFLRGEAISARPENWLQWLDRRVRRRPVFSASIAAGSLLAATMVGVALWLIAERAATARGVEAEQSERERASDDDLREMGRWLESSSWPEAAASLERARGRLGERGGSAGIRRRLDGGARDFELVVRLDDIRLARSVLVWGPSGKRSVVERLDEEYEAAFKGAGLGRVHDDPEVVASRVKASNIRSALVIALDHWAAVILDSGRKDWLHSVARMADLDLTSWRARARDPENWKDRATLAKVVADAPVDDQYVPLLLALEKHWSAIGEDSVPFLKRIQLAHPGDFWVNSRLGDLLHRDNQSGEAVRYYQAALAVRPSTGVLHSNLGLALHRSGRTKEAIEHLRLALKMEPMSVTHYLLASCLRDMGQIDEAIEHSRHAIRLDPKLPGAHTELGLNLEAKGRHVEALTHHRRAFELDPNTPYIQSELRSALMRQGRVEEARAAWEKSLAADPPDHSDWYGYAELCLFLGQEDEYRRARRALLAAFGDNTEPYLAERTARACLLRPVSGGELRRIVVLAERAWGVDLSKDQGVHPHFLFLRGLAEFRQGLLDRAISTMRGEASRVLGPAPRLVLAISLHQSGRVAEARKTLAAAVLSHDWRASQAKDQDGWIYHSLRREAEGMILPSLPAFLEGTYQPHDNDERLALLGVCQFTDRSEARARLYAKAFVDDPRLADDLLAGHRYNAACAATLAGSGRGTDAAGLVEPERRRWREQARQWLRSDLVAWNKVLDVPGASPGPVRTTLMGWRGDPNLSGLREPAELAKLSVEERNDCLAFWKEVQVMDERAERVR